MSKYSTLKAEIIASIKRNGAQAITGDLLQEKLLAMITSLGEYYQFGGLALPSTEFTAGDEPVVFIAATPGTYTDFGGLVVADGEVALLVWSGSAWSKQTTDIATRTEVSQLGQQVVPEISVLRNGERKNYGVGYTNWDIRNGIQSSTITDEGFSITTDGYFVFGYQQNLSDTPFSVGDTIYFGWKNVQTTLKSYSFLILFYDSNATEISRTPIIEDGFVYNSVIIPNGTSYFVIRIQATPAGTISADEFAVSTQPFNEQTIFGSLWGLEKTQEKLENLGIDGISDLMGVSSKIAASQKLATEIYNKFNRDLFDLSTEKEISVVENTSVNTEIPFAGFATTPYVFTLEQTGLIDANGVTVRFLSNGVDVGSFGLGNGQTVRYVATNDFDTIRFARAAAGIIGTGNVSFVIEAESSLFYTKEQIDSMGVTNKQIYVSPNGSDANPGTELLPVKTISRALSLSNKVILLAGIYPGETILPQSYNYPEISIIGQDAKKVVINFGTRHLVDDGSESLVSGYTKVYSVSCPNFPFAEGANYGFMWQDYVNDPNTLIDDADRHPLQRGREYRCDSTKIKQVSSIAEIESLPANQFGWYWDDGVMYFSRPQISSAAHPIIIPNRDARFIDMIGNWSARKQVKIVLNNVEIRYGGINLSYTANCTLSDVLVKYNYCSNGGCFYIYACQNCSLIRCEAAGVTNGESIGDGFNVDTAGTDDDPNALCLSLLMRDCWAHDVWDDGYSDHDNSEVTIDGGLFEYCGKGGLTPAYGSNDVIRNAICRYNAGSGILVTGVPVVSRIETNVVANGCLCYGQQYGFRSDSGGNLKCISCLSKDNQVGYGGAGKIYCYNCSNDNDVSAKDSGVIVHSFIQLNP